MRLLSFMFRPKYDEPVGYEIAQVNQGDAPFERLSDGTIAPSLCGDYSNYPGGFPQAMRDWNGGTYVGPRQEEEITDLEPEPDKPWWHLL